MVELLRPVSRYSNLLVLRRKLNWLWICRPQMPNFKHGFWPLNVALCWSCLLLPYPGKGETLLLYSSEFLWAKIGTRMVSTAGSPSMQALPPSASLLWCVEWQGKEVGSMNIHPNRITWSKPRLSVTWVAQEVHIEKGRSFNRVISTTILAFFNSPCGHLWLGLLSRHHALKNPTNYKFQHLKT